LQIIFVGNMKSIVKVLKWFFGILSVTALLITLSLYLFKDKIIGVVINEANQYLAVPVKVAKVDIAFWGSFPNLSVDFDGVLIRDALPDAHTTDTLLFTEKIRLKFNPLDLWKGNYHVKALEIRPGTIQIRTLADGQVNYNITKPSDTQSTTPFELKLKKIDISNLRVVYDNRATGQYYATNIRKSRISGDFSATRYTVDAQGNAFVKRAKSGELSLIKNKTLDYDFQLLVDTDSSLVSLPDAQISIAGLPFSLKGKVDADSLNFRVLSKDIQLTDLANNFSLAGDEIKKFKGAGKLDIDLAIFGPLDNTTPTTLICDFGVENGKLTEPFQGLTISNISVDGHYSNQGGAAKEELVLRKLHFQTAGGPFNANLKITEFASPFIQGQANGKINAATAHALFRFPTIDQIRGDVKVNAQFKIRNKADGKMDIQQCDGTVDLERMELKFLEDKRLFRNLNAGFFLKGNQAGFRNAMVEVGETDLKVNGLFSNIFDYINGVGALQTEVEIESRKIKLEDLGTTSKEQKIQDGRMFVLPEDIIGSVHLTVGNLQYDKHQFKHIVGKMSMKQRKIHFPQVSLVNADALVSGAIVIEEKLPEIFTITANVASRNLQFKPLFREWDNFEQSVITADNISGRAEADLYFHAPFDLRSGIIMKAINSKLDLRVYDGELRNISSFKEIVESLKGSAGKLVLGKNSIAELEKKLAAISFKTLENSIYIKDGKLEIPKMKVSSSALDLDIAGTHSFENEIDYRFGFRFRDLKANNRDSEFGEVIDDGTGLKIYMRMYGNLDNPTIEWDKSSRKEQAKENREQAKQDAKSILKSEFGLYKKDSTVKVYVPKDIPKEELKIQFGPATKEEFKVEEKAKKESKLKKTLQGWKEQQLLEDKASFKVN
jgi:hypothetical protein